MPTKEEANARDWFGGPRLKWVAGVGIFAVPLALLILPALLYSLDTPVGLFERSPDNAEKFASASAFFDSLHIGLVETRDRFKPFYYFWNGLAWKVFGELAWLHHLSSWLIWFGAVAFSIAAFRRISRASRTAGVSPRQAAGYVQIVPLALLAYLWLLFPTPIVARLEPIEKFAILLISLCNWAAALMLTCRKGGKSERRHHILFCLGFLGLAFSKETLVAPCLWLLICYWALVIAEGVSFKRLLASSTLTLTLFFVIYKVSKSLKRAEVNDSYFHHSKPLLERSLDNAADILQGLFQYETSIAITAVFIILLLALVVALIAKIARREFNGELAFVLLLLGEFISLFLVLTVQYGSTLRYWSILIPLLAMLLAFAARFLLERAWRCKACTTGIACALVAFMVFFASGNYYNFLYQFIIAHSARNADDLLIPEVAKLLESGQYVQLNPRKLHWEQSMVLDTSYNYEKHWPNSHYGKDSIKQVPPKDPLQPYYIVDIMGQPGYVSLDTHIELAGRADYGILDLPHKIASFIQGKAPHRRIDWGMNHLGDYRWVVHAVPHNMGQYLERLVSKAGEPVRDAFFDLHFDGDRLMYVRRPCLDDEIEAHFFLHLWPEQDSDLPPDWLPLRFQEMGFAFWDQGIKSGDLCVAVRWLPQYPVKWIFTGQYLMASGRTIWEMDFYPSRMEGGL